MVIYSTCLPVKRSGLFGFYRLSLISSIRKATKNNLHWYSFNWNPPIRLTTLFLNFDSDLGVHYFMFTNGPITKYSVVNIIISRLKPDVTGVDIHMITVSYLGDKFIPNLYGTSERLEQTFEGTFCHFLCNWSRSFILNQLRTVHFSKLCEYFFKFSLCFDTLHVHHLYAFSLLRN